MPHFRHVDPNSPRARAIARELGVEWSPRARPPATEAQARAFAAQVPFGEHVLSKIRRHMPEEIRAIADRAMLRAVELGLLEASCHGTTRLVRKPRPIGQRIQAAVKRRKAQRKKACRRTMKREILTLLEGDTTWYRVDEIGERLGYEYSQIERPVRSLLKERALVRRKGKRVVNSKNAVCSAWWYRRADVVDA